MAHPDYVGATDEVAGFALHEPVYGLTEGLTARPMAKAVRGALEKVPSMPEWQDAAFVKQRRFEPFNAALVTAHNPVHESDLSPQTIARQRLAYDELLANQLALLLIRANLRGGPRQGLSAGTGHPESQGGGRPALYPDRSATGGAGADRTGHGERRSACCGCCRAMSAAARPSWRCWPC